MDLDIQGVAMRSRKAALLGIAAMLEAALLAFGGYALLARAGLVQQFAADWEARKLVFVMILLIAAGVTYAFNQLAMSFFQHDSNRSAQMGGFDKDTHDDLHPIGDGAQIGTAAPQALNFEVSRSDQGSTLRVLGRGFGRGPAVIYAFLGICLSVVSLIALVKVIRHSANATLQGFLFISGCAVSFWLIAVWRGRFICNFELRRATLRVSTHAPILGRLYRYDAPWKNVVKIGVAFVPPGNAFAPGFFCLEVEQADGSRRRFLRGYPSEGLQYIAEQLDCFRSSSGVDH